LIAVAALVVLAAGMLPALGGARTGAAPHPKLGALRARQASLARAEQAAVLDLYSLESRLARSRAVLQGIEARAADLARRRAATRRRAGALRHSVATARWQLAQTLRSLYKQGQPDTVAIVLGASSVDQALSGLDDMRRAARSNRRLIDSLRRKEVQLRGLDDRLRAQNRALVAARERARSAVTELELVASARVAALGSLRASAGMTAREVARLDTLARRAERRSVKLVTPGIVTTAAPRPAAQAVSVGAETPTTTGTHTLVVDAVAYHLPGHTASGLPVGVGVVAVDPGVIPLGTRLFVPGYGKAVAADTGTAIRGAIIDLWMPSTAAARAWGRRTVTITVYG